MLPYMAAPWILWVIERDLMRMKWNIRIRLGRVESYTSLIYHEYKYEDKSS
jgi:hypothetical protein